MYPSEVCKFIIRISRNRKWLAKPKCFLPLETNSVKLKCYSSNNYLVQWSSIITLEGIFCVVMNKCVITEKCNVTVNSEE